MSTTITPTEQNIEINVNNDVIDINVTNEIVDVNATTQQIDINVAGAYPIPNPVLSVFGRTGVVVATEGDYTLTQLGDVTLTSPTNGQVLKYNGTTWVNGTDAGGLTSVGLSMPTAFTVTNSPLTSNGTIAVTGAGTTAQYVRGDGTLATFPSIITQAQNLVTEVYNRTGATLTKGTIVYINGGQGNLPTVTKALATGDSTSAQTYGVVQTDITNMNNGYVVVAGRLSDLDTQAYTEGTQLYLSSTTAGTWTSTKQYAPNHLVYVGIVVRAHPTQGIVEIKIQNGYELDEIHNVAAQTPSNNDGLFWESATNLWKNKSIATILGGTPVTGTGTTNYLAKFTGSSTIGIGQVLDDGTSVLIGTTSSTPNVKVGIYSTTQRALEVVSTNSNALFVQSPAAFIATISNGTWVTNFTNTGRLDLAGDLLVNTIANATTDTDRFLVSDSGVIKYRTGAELLSDIGGQGALTNPITGTGTSGQVAYFNGTNSITSNAAFAFTPTSQLLVNNSVTAASAIARGTNLTPTLTAAANGDVLVGLDINPTFTTGAFTNVGFYPLRVNGIVSLFDSTGATQIRIIGPSGSNKSLFFGNSSAFSAFHNVRLYNQGTTNLFVIATGDGTANPTDRFFITQGGNVGINTGGTDAGYRLDVNGTARVQGVATFLDGLRINGGYTSFNASTIFGSVAQSGNTFNFNTQYVGAATGATNYFNFTGTLASATGGSFVFFNMAQTLSNANSAQTYRGFYYNPTVTGLVANTSHIAFENTSGNVLLGTTSGNVAIGTSTLATATELTLGGSQTASSAIARGQLLNTTLVASANNDVLVGLDINPTFTNGAFTGVSNLGLRVTGNAIINGTLTGVTQYGTIGGGHYMELISTSSTNGYVNFRRGGGANGTYAYQLNNGSAYFSTNNGTGESTFGSFAGFFTNLYSGGTEALRIFGATRNVVIQNGGTFTDAGFRLDVNGTARVQGQLTTTADLSIQGFMTVGTGGGNVSSNIAMGFRAGASNTSGSSNVFLGRIAGENNTTGTQNTNVGFGSGAKNTTTSSNTNIGFGAGSENTGSNNTNIGVNALFWKTTGSDNIALGTNAGVKILGGVTNLTIANTSIFIGAGTQANANSETNQIVIGTSTTGLGSNTTVLGNSSTTLTALYGSVITGGTSINASAQLQVDSTVRGFLPPRMTTTQKTAISSPATGLVVYDTTLNKLSVYTGAAWETVTSL